MRRSRRELDSGHRTSTQPEPTRVLPGFLTRHLQPQQCSSELSVSGFGLCRKSSVCPAVLSKHSFYYKLKRAELREELGCSG